MYFGRGNDPITNEPYNGGKGQCGVLSKELNKYYNLNSVRI
jgi:hypothetical protein